MTDMAQRRFRHYDVACPECKSYRSEYRSRTRDLRCKACGNIFPTPGREMRSMSAINGFLYDIVWKQAKVRSIDILIDMMQSPMTAREIASRHDISRDALNNRLKRLISLGIVTRGTDLKRVKCPVYSLTDRARGIIASAGYQEQQK